MINYYASDFKPQINADERRFMEWGNQFHSCIEFLYAKILQLRFGTRMTRIRRIFTDPCVSVSSVQSVFYRRPVNYISAFINAETLRVLDSAHTYALQGIRGHAGSESYASRLGTHVCPAGAYVYAPSRGATLEARDSGRLHLRLIFERQKCAANGTKGWDAI